MIIKNYKYYNFVIYWFLVILTLFFLMILVGGLTRLTGSGLSITQWELFKGVIPPLKIETWNHYFSMYKQIPQFKLLNQTMTLNEFKLIFYWEYFHRILGRIVGLVYLLPLLFFTYKKVFFINSLIKLYVIFFIILLQGFFGWYMVKSGLVNDVTVSHYRLGIHLITAFFLILLLYWNYLNLKHKKNTNLFIPNKENIKFRFLILLIFLQILLGAYVSGLDAGKIYQTWPLMGNSFYPDDITILSIKNFLNFNNQSTVQFIHRNLAYIILIYSLFLFFYIFRNDVKILKTSISILLLVLIFQITLGILTLISGINMLLASLHQITGFFLFISVINLNYKSIK